MNNRRNIDNQKRNTLKIISGVGAGAILGAVPMPGSAALLDASATTEDLQITLISSPDVVENSMIIKNVSKQTVSVEKFHAGNVVFDGDIVDCNGSCATQALTLQSGQEKVFNVKQLDAQLINTSNFEYLDAQAATDYLPRGTRIVNLGAKISGKSGFLYQRRSTAA